MNHRAAGRAAVISLLLIIGLLGWLASLATPASEMTRLRNAMLLDVGQPSDFNWLPGQHPASFQAESGQVPAEVMAFTATLPEDNNWQTTLAAVDALRGDEVLGAAIQSNTVDTLQKIVSTGFGYCSDYTQVMNAIAYAKNVPVREWGMSFDGFGGWGHAFSEVYSDSMQKWLFIDAFNGFYVTDKTSGHPMSVLELRENLEHSPEQIVFHPLDEQFGFKSSEHALKYYQRGMYQFYLWWGNDSLTYDTHPIVKVAASLGRPVEQLTAIIVGTHPRIRVLPLPENEDMREHMVSVRYQLIFIFFAGCLLGVAFLYFCVRWWRLKNNNK